MGLAETYNPWRELRALTDVELRWAILPDHFGGAIAVVQAGRRVIVLDPRLDRTERRAAVLHEVIHHQRGLPPRRCPEDLRAKEEETVRRETARRLVPLDQLRTFAAARAELGPVTVDDVAEHFDVPASIAAEACRQAR